MHFCKASLGSFALCRVQALAPGDFEELLEERADLPGGGGMHAQAAAGFEPEVVGGGLLPCAHQEPEVAARLFTQQILAPARGVAVHVPQEQVAALGEGGEQAGLINAAVMLRGQQHAGIPRVQREGQHLPADGSEGKLIAGFELMVDRLQGAQVGEEFFRVGEGLFLGWFEPAKRAQVFHPGGFQGQDDLGQVQTLDLGEFLLRTMRVLLLRPEPPAQPRRSAAGAPGALVGRGPADLLDQQGVDAPIRIIARNARQPAVNHTPDAVNGQRGLGDVGGDHDLALIVTCHGGILVARRQFAVQREQDEAAGLGRNAGWPRSSGKSRSRPA